MKKKLRILFPYVEAGLGHIIPMKAFVSEFKKNILMNLRLLKVISIEKIMIKT